MLLGAGAFGVEWLRSKTGKPYGDDGPKHRSVSAIRSKACRMGLGGLGRGSMTLAELVEATGYSRTQLLRAQYALSQKWKRTGPRGPYLITEDQKEDLMEWLKHDYWCKAKHLYVCVWYSGSNRRHYSAGLCGTCHKAHFRLCRALGIPTALEDQIRFLERVKATIPEDCDKVWIKSALWRLRKGLALDIETLDKARRSGGKIE